MIAIGTILADGFGLRIPAGGFFEKSSEHVRTQSLHVGIVRDEMLLAWDP